MSEMVERVARAICAADDEPWDELGETSEDNAPFGYSRQWYRGLARAAIAAMREPTEEMISGEGVHEHVHWDYSCYVCGGAQEHWYAMIDAALKE